VLVVSVTISCNYGCYYCPVKKWLRPITGEQTPDDVKNNLPRVNTLTNEPLLKWLDAYIEPEKWVIEITGGEPGLYPEINTLIPALAGRGYRGLIKTNGSLPIVKSGAFKLVAAWHKDQDFPVCYDEILIIKNPDDDWKGKVKHCEENGIKCHTVLFDNVGKGIRIEKEYCSFNKIIASCHINSSGIVTPCSRIKPTPEHTVFNMAAPQPMKVILKCPRCKNINDVEMFLDEDVKAKIEADFEEFKRNP